MKKVNFTPVGGTLIYLPKVDKKTESGIIKSPEMIEAEKETRDNFMTVAVVAEGETRFKAGDKVLVDFTKGSVIVIDGVEYGLMPPYSLLGYRKG